MRGANISAIATPLVEKLYSVDRSRWTRNNTCLMLTLSANSHSWRLMENVRKKEKTCDKSCNYQPVVQHVGFDAQKICYTLPQFSDRSILF